MKIEQTKGYQIAMTFKPFISPSCTEHMEIVKDMAKSINAVINDTSLDETGLKIRVRQFLSALDYGSLTDFQAKCVLLLEQELK